MIGAVLAGGAGRRMGGDKALASLAGRPLVLHVLERLAAVLGPPVLVVVKPDTALPRLPDGALRVDEPPEPRHPLTGVRAALEHAGGAPVLACAVDLPLVPLELLHRLVAARPERVAVPTGADGALEPAIGLWTPAALPALTAAAPGVRMRDVIAALEPVTVALREPLHNVNTPQDLAALEVALSRT